MNSAAPQKPADSSNAGLTTVWPPHRKTRQQPPLPQLATPPWQPASIEIIELTFPLKLLAPAAARISQVRCVERRRATG
jgi:hypothetical protein